MTLKNGIMLMFIAILTAAAVPAVSQTGGNTAYKGGAGDGYDMAELEIQPLFTAESVLEVQIRPNILQPGQVIRLPHGIVPEQAYLTGTNGVRFAFSGDYSMRSDLEVPGIPPGLYILRFNTGDGTRYHAKIVVMQP